MTTRSISRRPRTRRRTHAPIATNLREVTRQYGIRLLYHFGSIARGDAHATSDVDVAYLSERPLTLRDEYTLTEALRASDTIPRNREVDLVDLRHAPPLLLYRIAREGRRLYGNAAEDDAAYRRAVKRYIDARPLFEAMDQYVREQCERTL